MLKLPSFSSNGPDKIERLVRREHRRVMRKLWWAGHTTPISARRRQKHYIDLGNRWEYYDGQTNTEYENGIYMAIAKVVVDSDKIALSRRKKLIKAGIVASLVGGIYGYTLLPEREIVDYTPQRTCNLEYQDIRPTANIDPLEDLRAKYETVLMKTNSTDSLIVLERMLNQNVMGFNEFEIGKYKEIIEQKYYKMEK